MTLPSLQPRKNGVLLTLEDGSQILIRTETQARQLGDLLRRAENVIGEQTRQRASQLDREAAQDMASADRKTHKRWGSVLQGWPAAPVVPTQTLLNGDVA